MKIIKTNKENINIINKSKFIGIVNIIYQENDIKKILDNIKKTYPDATHICYAYILNNNKKYSDDKEPLGTAGLPILDILEKNNLNHCLAIVVRYFGGIKLGSNGLVRAYSSTISDLLINNTKELEKGYLIRINEDYHHSEQLNYLLKNSNIIKKEYLDKLTIEVIVNQETLNDLKNYNYTIIEEKII